MPKGRKSPGTGRGENLADPAEIRRALAIEILDQERLAEQKEFRKRHRSTAEGKGVNLSELDGLYKRRDDPVHDIFADFKRKLYYFGAIFRPLKQQYDLFTKASESVEMQNAAYQAGLYAGMSAKPASPPPNLAGEDAQLWLEGHGLGIKDRAAAERERKAEEKKAEEEKKAARDAVAAAAIDGTGQGDQAAQVRAQAAADFAKDNPDVQAPPEAESTKKGPDPAPVGDGIFDGDGTLPETSTGYAGKGERYMIAGDDTYPSGRRAAYEDGKPVGSSIPGKMPVYVDHPPAAGDDGFEATAEELAAQQNRPSRQQGPEIDEAEIASEAAKLKASGFVPEKPKRGARRLPVEKTS